MKLVQFLYPSPIGTIRLVSDGAGLVGLYLPNHKREAPAVPEGTDAITEEAARQLDAYFAGERTEFTVPLGTKGTPFQQTVWEELKRIPPGETVSYGELARRIGQPTAVRAVAGANARNPVSIIVPCHRVVGSNGKLTGYAGGLTAKEFLLALERR